MIIERNQESEVISHTALRWSAPEYFKPGSQLGPAVDIWAFACTLIEIYGNIIPFVLKEDSEVRKCLYAQIPPLVP